MNADLLEEKIRNSGLRIGFIADEMGISLQALNKKRNGAIAFSFEDAKVLKRLLGLSNNDVGKIFLE